MTDHQINHRKGNMTPYQAEAISEPFEVLRVGRFKHPTFGTVQVSQADLDRAVSNFQRFRSIGAEAPVDYDHSFRTSGSSRAAGWITDLARKGRTLIARVRWTEAAAKQIRRGEYRYFSPEFISNYRDESGNTWGFAVLSGALTNRPFLKGMTPVALTEKGGPPMTIDPEDRDAVCAAIEQMDGTLTYGERVDRIISSSEAHAEAEQRLQGGATFPDREVLDRRIREVADSHGLDYGEAFNRVLIEEENDA